MGKVARLYRLTAAQEASLTQDQRNLLLESATEAALNQFQTDPQFRQTIQAQLEPIARGVLSAKAPAEVSQGGAPAIGAPRSVQQEWWLQD
jgi:hypothetical protein